MGIGSRNIPVRSAKHLRRHWAALVALPALVLSPFTVQALLIHDHHGHDTHVHTVGIGDLEALRENSEHRHEKHDHDGLPVDPVEDESTPILIMLGLPEALPGGRTVSADAAVATSIGAAHRNLAINSCVVEDSGAHVENQRTLADIPRARSLVAGILLSNHALLL